MQYLIPKARNNNTGQTIKAQDLNGARYPLHQRALAEDYAAQMAAKMTERTGDTWRGFVETYTPSVRNEVRSFSLDRITGRF